MADQNEDSRNSAPAGQQTNNGPFLAKVVSHIDKTYMGDLQVQLLRESGAQQPQKYRQSKLTRLAQENIVSPLSGEDLSAVQ